ncbi:nucleotide sugar dehydrogenase [Paracoccaceae bacterium]|nr:nucleotide sugar dehydrogenase [Paracoccaceae bacterium]
MNYNDIRVCVIGLGYVGLPLFLSFSKHFTTYGFDIDSKRISELKSYKDISGEQELVDAYSAENLSSRPSILSKANVFIVTVPTPVLENHKPDFKPLISATTVISKHITPGSVIIFESTVYPGATEEICIPLLTEGSKLKLNEDIFCGYSPERINPGDKTNTIDQITKVVAGSNETTAAFIEFLYSRIIHAGIHIAPSIKVAEASKIIENVQRDVNIALMNEFSKFCDKMNISTKDVLNAAATKWNFINFVPGLVGGHCIGIDPYYLIEKAESLNVELPVIKSARLVNEGLPEYVAAKIHFDIGENRTEKSNKILIFGATFKEDCADTRNSKVFDVASHLNTLGFKVDVFDPYIKMQAHDLNRANIIENISDQDYVAVILAVPHREFKEKSVQFYEQFLISDGLFFDIKSAVKSSSNIFSL